VFTGSNLYEENKIYLIDLIISRLYLLYFLKLEQIIFLIK